MSHTGWSYATSLTGLRILLIFVTQENLMPCCIRYKHSFACMTGSAFACQIGRQLGSLIYTCCEGHRARSQPKVVHCKWAWLCENFSHHIQVCVELRYRDERMSNVISHFLITHSGYPAKHSPVLYIRYDNMSKDCNQVFISRIDYIYPQSSYLTITSTRWGAGRCALRFWR